MSMLRHNRDRSAFPTKNAIGVRQSELSFILARLAVRSAGA